MKKISILFFIIFLVGCLSKPPAPITVETPPVPTSTPWIQPTPKTTFDESPTQIPAGFSIQNHCPEIAVGIDKLPILDGTLVFSSYNALNNKDNLLRLEPGGNSSVSFWDPQANTIMSYELPEEFYYYIYAESPDKEKLAITQGKTLEFSTDMLILNREGKEVKRIAFPEEWTFFTWWGNEKLLFRQFRQQNPNLKEKLDLVSIDFSDEKQTILPSDFPNIYTREMPVTWGALTIFNPARSHVVYPERERDVGQIISILWDLKKNEEIARIANGNWPIWSPEGNRLLLIVDVDKIRHEWRDEIYIINFSGDISRVTFFEEHFDDVLISLPAWSPNGRYVSFWIHPELSYRTANLAVLDIETLTVDLFCNEINPFPWRFGEDWTLHYANFQINSVRPIWSPDSKYVLIENNESGISSAFLFDLENHAISQITLDARPVAWLR